MVAAMQRPIQRWVNPSSDILSPDVEVALANQLALHHATHAEKLNKKSFEYLFKYANEAAGRSSTIEPNATSSGADIVVDGIRYSLKTQSDSAIRPNTLFIQKLMEARWIRDCPDVQSLSEELAKRVSRHIDRYDRILVLRAFNPAAGHLRYELIEIPKSVIALLTTIRPEQLSEKNKYGSSGAEVQDDKGPAYRVLLDGSVEKIRIFSLRIDRCFKHGWWVIPLPDP